VNVEAGVMLPDTRDRATQEREAALRERLHRLGYELRRSPVRDTKHPACNGYMIVDIRQHFVVAGYEPLAFSLDLDGVADWLRTMQTHSQ
jgi:hypothetical protein